MDNNSAAALKFASELAEGGTSTLYLLHVVSVPRLEPTMLEPNPIFSEEVAQRELQKLLQQHLTTGPAYRIMTRKGNPAAVIVAVGEELGADLIVMPTHGHQGVQRMILGNVAEQIVREAGRPVLTIGSASRVSKISAAKKNYDN